MSRQAIQPPSHARQVRFHALLVVARKTWLIEALGNALGKVDPLELKSQLATFIPTDVQKILAVAGIRDEQVFPSPIVLEVQPTLVGYYRLLLGIPQKSFYSGGSGMGMFRSMEMQGRISPKQQAALPDFCTAMAPALAQLVREITPTISPRDVVELPLLTLGSQFQGGNNNTIGQVAIKAVYDAIIEVVDEYITERSSSEIRVSTPAGRRFIVALAGDPDVRVQEDVVSGKVDNLLSIEVKGGTDKSNAYNRGGEAEKSHQNARVAGFQECWTIIGMAEVDIAKLKRGSPSTNQWFETSEILARQGNNWDDFTARIKTLLGLSDRRS